MANENAIVSVTLASQDLLSSTQPTLVSRQLLNQIYAANQIIYNGYITTTSTAPSANLISGGLTAGVVFLRNLALPFLTVVTTNPLASSMSNSLGQNGFILFYSSLIGSSGNGISTITFALTSAGGTGILEAFIAI